MLVGKGVTFVSFFWQFVVAIAVQVTLFYLPVESFLDQEQVSDLHRPLSVFEYAYMVYGKFIHSFSSLFYDRSKAPSKGRSPHSAIQSFLLQMRVFSLFCKVIQ
jgi:hypothetical protein